MECCDSKNIIKDNEKCIYVQIVIQFMDILG